MSVSVVHLIQSITRGGACRAAIAAAKYSSQCGDYSHFLAQLIPGPFEFEAGKLASDAGLTLYEWQEETELLKFLECADIVQLNWWNSPQMSLFLRSNLPAMRLLAWFHVGGRQAPHVITKELLDFMDFSVACSPYTYECPAIQNLLASDRINKTGMAYGAGDLERISHFTPQPHETFNVGYIGTVDWVKMHSQYVNMSAAAQIPNVRFIVCGNSNSELEKQVVNAGFKDKFELKGYVDDIKPILETLDVYGYPLCEDTYAASEINLQEVMYCGIPVVVFPYGGVSKLVIDNYTGIVVRSPEEYTKALEFLYHHPEERKRLGGNAREYARQIFGADKAAKQLNEYYAKLMQIPKRTRMWNSTEQSVKTVLNNNDYLRGARLFVESLGNQADDFRISMSSSDIQKVFHAEERISKLSKLMSNGALGPYANYFKNDPLLSLWSGLSALGSGDYDRAIMQFVEAIQRGLNDWRLLWYLGLAAKRRGVTQVLEQAASNLDALIPEGKLGRTLVSNEYNDLIPPLPFANSAVLNEGVR